MGQSKILFSGYLYDGMMDEDWAVFVPELSDPNEVSVNKLLGEDVFYKERLHIYENVYEFQESSEDFISLSELDKGELQHLISRDTDIERRFAGKTGGMTLFLEFAYDFIQIVSPVLVVVDLKERAQQIISKLEVDTVQPELNKNKLDSQKAQKVPIKLFEDSLYEWLAEESRNNIKSACVHICEENQIEAINCLIKSVKVAINTVTSEETNCRDWDIGDIRDYENEVLDDGIPEFSRTVNTEMRRLKEIETDEDEQLKIHSGLSVLFETKNFLRELKNFDMNRE